MLRMLDPKEFPLSGQRDFEKLWGRTARTAEHGIFGPEAVSSRFAAVVNPYMVHYHSPVTTTDTNAAGESQTRELHMSHKMDFVPVSEAQVGAIAAARKDYTADKESPDAAVRKGATFRFYAKMRRAEVGPETVSRITNSIVAGKQKDKRYHFADYLEPGAKAPALH